MLRLAAVHAAVVGLALAGCSVGDEDHQRSMNGQQSVIDDDGDGVPEGIDLDGDGESDIDVGAICEDILVDDDGDGQPDALDLDCDGEVDIAWCEQPLIDDDGDGIPEGIDLNCDGESDVDLGAELPDLPDPGDLPDGDVPGDDDGDGIPDDLCVPAAIDDDGDGVPEGIDLDCDGVADLELDQ
jgi:hypothetical protein